jgi:peptidoglycan/LPS O-acetylase OafA/YrhL
MNEIRALTGLRGIAAIVVFFAHVRDTLETRGFSLHVPTLVERLCLSSGRQVDIFFVLSGFVLALIYRDWFASSVTRGGYGQFLKRRFARIYPLHAFMLLMIIAFVFAAHVFHVRTINGLERYEVSSLPASFLLMQAWGFLGNDPGHWNRPAWSVSIEALAYLIFPFYILLTYKLERSRPWPVFIAVSCFGFLLNASTNWGLAGYPGIARGLSEFMLGCATAGFYGSQVDNWLRSSLGSSLAFVGLLVCFALTPDTGFVIALFTAPLLLALCGNNAVASLFSNRPVYFLGEISYSIYLGHFLFSTVSYRLISVPWMQTGPLQLCTGLCFIILFVLVGATVTYFTIERPGRDLLRGRKVSTRPADAAAENSVSNGPTI